MESFCADRYASMSYRRCGRSGLMLPAISLGMWHNFGTRASHENARAMMRTAFDLGITHFDLANNYGPEPGSAEERVGRILRSDFAAHRDELILSTKAGYRMQPGPYGEWGSRKYLLASLDQSLKRLGVDYVDVFYSHRFDPNTPLEETIGALEQAVRQGKALYAGISSYFGGAFIDAMEVAKRYPWPPVVIHQPAYNLLNRRRCEEELFPHVETYGVGVICFSPLAQGMLTSKYLDPVNRIPSDSRAADPDGCLQERQVSEDVIARVRRAAKIAEVRGQTMAQMALAWVLRDARVTSALIGARSSEQIADCAAALQGPAFTLEELAALDEIFPAQ